VGAGVYYFIIRPPRYGDIIKANVELVCFQEENRLIYEYMEEDGVPRSQIPEGLKRVVEKDSAIAQKYGWEDGREIRWFVYDNYSDWQKDMLIKAVEKKVRKTCSPDFKYEGL